MRAGRKSLWRITAIAAVVLLSLGAFAAGLPHYLITNNDNSQANSATFYTIAGGGQLTQAAVVPTGGFGWDGLGYVITDKINVSHDPTAGDCVFLSDYVLVNGSPHPDVTAISISTLKATGNFQGSQTDQVQNLGMGVTSNAGYVYANFTASQTIGTFKKMAGCKLQFVQDTAATGLGGGSIVGMMAHHNILVAAFGDGSIESFDISTGVAVSNGDLQYSTGHVQNGHNPSGVDITADGHFAVFGDSTNFVEVSDLSTGKLAPTVVYSGLGSDSALGGIWLSPDETVLYLSNFSSGQVEAAFFDKTTGVVSAGCTSAVLRGYNHLWAFLAGMATASRTGTGGALYVAEPDARIGIVRLTSGGGTCSFAEAPGSPVLDSSTRTIESVGVFPPRPF